MGDKGRRRGAGRWVSGGVVRDRWQQPHKVEAAAVEVGVAPRLHHQDSLGVVVEGGDAGRHADSEGDPGHAGETEGGGGVGGARRQAQGVQAHMCITTTQHQTRLVCLSEGCCFWVHVRRMWCV